MSFGVKKFYDDLAQDYHFIFKDWEQWMKNQGKILHELISIHYSDKSVNLKDIKVLDCAAGIGTQAIGLALYGYKVHATDISSNAIKRATKESIKFLKPNQISFDVVDFCNLDKCLSHKKHTFDIVICCDNALPHLLTNDLIKKALKSMKNMLKKNGLLILSVRDYDKIRNEKYLQTGTTPKCFIRKNDNHKLYRQITFQNWEWSKCKNYYKVDHFIMIEMDKNNQYKQEKNDVKNKKYNIEFVSDGLNLSQIGDIKNWNIECRTTIYNALRKQNILSLLKQSGFDSIEWLSPSESKYYQPIIIARNTLRSSLL